MNKILYYFIFISLFISILACGSKRYSAAKFDKDNKSTENEANKKSEEDIKNFLYDVEGQYGWKTTSDSISFDFFKDGRLHIQGPDGEATMWEGSWTLKGDQLTMERIDIGKIETVRVKMDKEKLILGDKTYVRYKP